MTFDTRVVDMHTVRWSTHAQQAFTLYCTATLSCTLLSVVELASTAMHDAQLCALYLVRTAHILKLLRVNDTADMHIVAGPEKPYEAP
jgi:hypothetical protein